MQKLITKYGLAAHLAFLVVAPLFLSLTAVFWVVGLAVVWVFLEPSRIGSETLHEAQRRVFKAVLRDPLFWFSLLLVGVCAFRFLNTGIDRAYDAENLNWFLAAAKFPTFPGSVKGTGYESFVCMSILAVAFQGCRHAMGKSARMVFCHLTSVLTGGCVCFYAYRMFMGDQTILAMLDCKLQAPSFWGCICGVQVLAGIVALIAAFERKWNAVMMIIVLAIAANAAGVFMFAPVRCQLVFAAAAVVTFVYSFFYVRRVLAGTGRFKFVVLFGVALTIGAALVIFTVPEQALSARLTAWTAGEFFPQDYWKVRETLNNLCLTIWKGNPWLGCGLGAFSMNLQFTAAEADWQTLPVGLATPLSGYWYILSEQGIVGALLLIVPLGFLFFTYIARLAAGMSLVVLHPACWLGVVALVAVAVEALWDISSVSPVVLATVLPLLAISANSFPKERKDG